MLVVIGLGGNALLRRDDPMEANVQRMNVRAAAASVAQIAQDHAVVITHGNGPQVGLLALQAQTYTQVRPYPLDILSAETEGMLGYIIGQELQNHLPGRKIATLLTQVEVHPADPAFKNPEKPIGPRYKRAEAEQLAEKYAWNMAKIGEEYRRVVASPEPRWILELDTIKLLLEAEAVVICAGGGGIPVVPNAAGGFSGVEAVIDKDLSSALLARALHADRLLLLTDVDAVYSEWGSSSAIPLLEAKPSWLRKQSFEPGSMGPKVEAACRFVEQTGKGAVIGRLADAMALLEGRAGTRIVPD